MAKTPGQFLIESLSLQYHDTLNDKLWELNGYLNPHVKLKLLEIADSWIEFCHISHNIVKDVIITGGNCNFNYTPVSDIDLHIVIDFKDISKNVPMVEDFMMTKKSLWAAKHNIHIYGYPIELYTQPITEHPHSGQGVYSLLKDDWIQKPTHQDLNFVNNPHIERKTESFQHQIEHIIQTSNVDAGNKLKEKFKNMRGAAIRKAGEFAYENLVFKELRNRGALDKLTSFLSSSRDKALSI